MQIPNYNKIHNRFLLNGYYYDQKTLKEVAYNFIKESKMSFSISSIIERIDEKMRNETVRREIGFDSLWKRINKRWVKEKIILKVL